MFLYSIWEANKINSPKPTDDGISIDDSSDEEDVEDNISPDDESQTSSDEDDGM